MALMEIAPWATPCNKVSAIVLSWTSIYVALVGAAVAHLGWKLAARYRSLRQAPFARIYAEELKAKLDLGEDLMVLDLRHPLDLLADPYTIPGAQRVTPQDLRAINGIGRDKLLVFYCTCPNGPSSLETAQLLARRGFGRIRPLCGGVEGWRQAGYPLEEIVELSSAAAAP